MAITFDHQSAQYALQAEGRANPTRLGAENVSSGELEFTKVVVTLDDSESAADTLAITALPIGAVVLPEFSKAIVTVDSLTNCTVDIGYEGNPDALADGIDLAPGGIVEFTSGTAPADLVPTPLVADTDEKLASIYATFGGTPAGTGTIYFVIAFRRNR